ncbi:MAG TPA: hypothetical protein VMZ30_04130 [Pyrinomonadaceae bacterium]|nr:hypothetical protein [Pyrinomonadaceae bacterium]
MNRRISHGFKRKRVIVILALLAVLVLYPFKITVAPEKRVLVITNDMHPVRGRFSIRGYLSHGCFSYLVMDLHSQHGVWYELKPKKLAKKDRQHSWLFAQYFEAPSEREDARWFKVFLFRVDGVPNDLL